MGGGTAAWHAHRRQAKGTSASKLTQEDISRSGVYAVVAQDSYIENRNWFQRNILDWKAPWWVSILLYIALAAGWAACWYFTLIYGVKFSFDQVCRAEAATAENGSGGRRC